MIVSHKHKFIFIKTVKTAGTSIEVELNKILGPDDIATPVAPPVKGHEPQNHDGNVKMRLENHMTARSIRDYVGERIFNDYFVFCVEREPVEKCISYYSMLKNSPFHSKGNRNMSFKHYMSNGQFPIDVDKYVDENKNIMADKVIKYENLTDELREIGERLGFKIDMKSKVKSGFRENFHVNKSHVKTIYKAFEESNFFTGYTMEAYQSPTSNIMA